MLPPRPSLLSERSLIPVGLVGALLVAVGGGAWWLSAMYSQQTELSRQMTATGARLDRIEQAIKDNNSEMVTMQSMRLWIATLGQRNASLSVPEMIR